MTEGRRGYQVSVDFYAFTPIERELLHLVICKKSIQHFT